MILTAGAVLYRAASIMASLNCVLGCTLPAGASVTLSVVSEQETHLSPGGPSGRTADIALHIEDGRQMEHGFDLRDPSPERDACRKFPFKSALGTS